MLTRLRNFRILPCRPSRFYSNGNNPETEDESIYDREFAEIKVEDYADLYKDNDVLRGRIETIINEYEFKKYNSMGRVPSTMTSEDMKLLLDDGCTPNNRDKLFRFLFKREMDKRASKLKIERQKQEAQARRSVKLKEFEKRGAARTGLLSDNGDILYGLWHNSLFCRIPENRLKGGSSASRLTTAAMFGRKLIFDFSFDEYMVKHTSRNAVDQVQEAYGMNRFFYQEPFDIWFCNFKESSISGQYCTEKAIKNLHSGSMITVKEDCFTNHFDKSQLVYLTPNAREPLGKINKSDDIYIIGVYNDKGHQKPVTYRKALKLGIRARCLPLDSHVVWQGSSKSLCVNHVTGILLEVMANGGDWQAALMKHIPKRKIKPMDVVAEEEEKRLARLLKTRKQTPQFSLRNDFDWS
uniref:RNA (guanine-9-)-methyltransferase domain-containing protein 1 n=1 Tax=Aceria tosichella TaxID=561515 RepID=A0A6G1SQ65_9ACAR